MMLRRPRLTRWLACGLLALILGAPRGLPADESVGDKIKKVFSTPTPTPSHHHHKRRRAARRHRVLVHRRKQRKSISLRPVRPQLRRKRKRPTQNERRNRHLLHRRHPAKRRVRHPKSQLLLRPVRHRKRKSRRSTLTRLRITRKIPSRCASFSTTHLLLPLTISITPMVQPIRKTAGWIALVSSITSCARTV